MGQIVQSRRHRLRRIYVGGHHELCGVAVHPDTPQRHAPEDGVGHGLAERLEQGAVPTGPAVQQRQRGKLPDEGQVRLRHAGQGELRHAPVHRPRGKLQPGVLRRRFGGDRRGYGGGSRGEHGGRRLDGLSGGRGYPVPVPARQEEQKQQAQQRQREAQQQAHENDPFFIHRHPFRMRNFSVYQYTKPCQATALTIRKKPKGCGLSFPHISG